LQSTNAPMAEVASIYLPVGAAMFVTFGAIMAIMTALNGTLMVPSRLALMFVEDHLAPRWIGFVNRRTATPIRALTLTLGACILLLVSGQLSLALNVAVFALVVLYFIHSLVFLLLPYRNPKLNAEITVNIPTWLQRASAVFSVVAMGMLIVIQLLRDADTLSTKSLSERISEHSLTSIELVVVWSIVGAGLYGLARVRAGRKLKIDGN
jgi:amino acid transporter